MLFLSSASPVSIAPLCFHYLRFINSLSYYRHIPRMTVGRFFTLELLLVFIPGLIWLFDRNIKSCNNSSCTYLKYPRYPRYAGLLFLRLIPSIYFPGVFQKINYCRYNNPECHVLTSVLQNSFREFCKTRGAKGLEDNILGKELLHLE